MMQEYADFTKSIVQAGQLKAGDRLKPTSTASTVRVRNGKVVITDGPFAETREQLGGYYLVEAKNLDEALAIAARIPRRQARQHRSASDLVRCGVKWLPRRTLEDVLRREAGRVFATLIRLLGDFDLAEEARQEAFAAALEQWPQQGMPANPRAWLIRVGRNKAIDQIRRAIDVSHQDRRSRSGEAERRRPISRRRRRRGGVRRRPAASDIHLLPSGAEFRGADCAHASRGMRPDDAGRRARLPGGRGDDGAAAGSRQEKDPRGRNSVRDAGTRRYSISGSRACSRWCTACSPKGMRRPPARN